MDNSEIEQNIIAIGADHAGFELKEKLKLFLDEIRRPYKDYGTFSETSTDYPDWGAKVAQAVSKGIHTQAILVCGAGIGMSIVANKFPGVRAALCSSEFLAEICRRHNNSNIIVFGGRTTTELLAQRMLKIWLETEFEGGRHVRRLDKVDALSKLIHPPKKHRD